MSEDETEEVSINEDKPIRKESVVVSETVEPHTLEDMSQKSFTKDESDEIPNMEKPVVNIPVQQNNDICQTSDRIKKESVFVPEFVAPRMPET